MAKYNKSIHKDGYFHGVSNINLNLIMCEDNIVIPLILQILYSIGNMRISYIKEWTERR